MAAQAQEWWRAVVHDPLLDRHTVAIDVAEELSRVLGPGAWGGGGGDQVKSTNALPPLVARACVMQNPLAAALLRASCNVGCRVHIAVTRRMAALCHGV